jgi:Tfp pilus assembly protein PilV
MSRDEGGIAIVEVLVSALVLLIFSLGVFTVLTGSTRATAQERHRSQANALAEQELERVRSFRIADLVSLNATRRVLDDGTQLAGACPTTGPQASQTCYTITSQAQFQNEPAATSGCSAGSGSRDYLLITVSVSWSGMGVLHPVTASTIASPPSGSLVPNSGSVLVNVTDSRNVGIQGVALSGSGAGSFSGTTGPTGCVLWRNVPVGTYTMTVGGVASAMVDQNGNAPPAQTVSVVDQGTNTVNLQYDRPGSIQGIGFRTRDYSNNLVASSADSVIVSNTGMQTAKAFTPPGGVRATSISTTSTLFPFTSPYAVYAGTCASNNPPATPPPGAMLGNATVPVAGAGTLATPGYIQLPSLQATVWSGTSTLPGSPVSGAKVTARDTGCNVTRTLTPTGGTNSNGQIPQLPPSGGDIGLPYGTYDVCASNPSATGKRTVTAVALTSAGSTGTALNIFLGGQPAGTCP